MNFLVDSGASHSTIRPCDLPFKPILTESVYISTSASGHVISENFTVPLRCETDGGTTLWHAFLCSPNFPTPLMARDLMCELNLTLTAGPSGISIQENPEACCLKFDPQWAYEWQTHDCDWEESILKMTKSRTVFEKTDYMAPDKLHCTSHVVIETRNKVRG